MNQKIVNEFDDVLDRKVEVHEIKQEVGKLAKMLKMGFEAKPVGMERVSKVYASNDEKKISKFYDQMASWINAIKLTGSFDQFQTYMKITHGVDIEVSDSTSLVYNTNIKKLGKFRDLYSEYFMEEPTDLPSEAVSKILASIENLTKEATGITEEVKELLENIVQGQVDHSPETLKTVERILTKARIKELQLDEATGDIEFKITAQQQALDLLAQ